MFNPLKHPGHALFGGNPGCPADQSIDLSDVGDLDQLVTSSRRQLRVVELMSSELSQAFKEFQEGITIVDATSYIEDVSCGHLNLSRASVVLGDHVARMQHIANLFTVASNRTILRFKMQNSTPSKNSVLEEGKPGSSEST